MSDQNILNFTEVRSKFIELCQQVQSFHTVSYISDKRHKSLINILVKITINSLLEYEYNLPTTQNIFILQSRFNFSFHDANQFVQARYMYFQIHTIDMLYYVLDNMTRYIIEDEKLGNKSQDFGNRLNIVMNAASIDDFKHYQKITIIFTKIRNSFHNFGIYKDGGFEETFGDITFSFKKNKGVPMTANSHVYLLKQIITLIELLVRSEKFSKYYEPRTSK